MSDSASTAPQDSPEGRASRSPRSSRYPPSYRSGLRPKYVEWVYYQVGQVAEGAQGAQVANDAFKFPAYAKCTDGDHLGAVRMGSLGQWWDAHHA